MNIEELKKKIETSSLDNSGMIFVYKDRFLADMYVKAISKLLGKQITYGAEMQDNSLFSFVDQHNLYVVSCDEYNDSVPNDTIVLTKKSKNKAAIEFPKLEPWQIKDYVNSMCKGLDEHTSDKLLSYSSNLWRLQNELDKITIFDEKIQKTVFDEFLSDGLFYGLDVVDTFDFINAICSLNIDFISKSYKIIHLEPMAFVALLLRQFSNLVTVCLQDNPTESNTGLKEKQIWAIKNVGKRIGKQKIFNVYKFLLGIDYKLKSGELSTDIMFDYVLFKVILMLR